MGAAVAKQFLGFFDTSSGDGMICAAGIAALHGTEIGAAHPSETETPLSSSATLDFDPIEERLPVPKLFTLGFQHVLVMYAGAIAVPLIVGRALQLSPQEVAFLISADLFVCGLVSIIQSFGATQWFGIKLPVMMGVTFAAVGPMIAIAQSHPGQDGRADAVRGDHGGGGDLDLPRAAGQPDAAVLPERRDRDGDPGDRRQPDADRDQLDLRAAGRADRAEARRPGAGGLARVRRSRRAGCPRACSSCRACRTRAMPRSTTS